MHRPSRLGICLILVSAMTALYVYIIKITSEQIMTAGTGDVYFNGNSAFHGVAWLNQDPFTFWRDKHVYRQISDLDVREEDITKSIYNNENHSCRVTTLMNKVLRGEPVKMTVIGGSNSAGGGISDHERLFHQLFSQWWNHVILPHTGSKLTVENLSLGGTGSDFFTFCLQNFISNNEEPDIMIIELSVNDYGYLHGATARPMELLTRRVLSLSSFPLVLYVSLVDLVKKGASLSSIKNPRCHNLEDLGQHELARHYGITLLSWRDILCPLNPVKRIREADIRPGMVNSDHLHIDMKGHAQVALMIIRYFQNFLQRAWQLYCTRSAIKPPLFTDSSILVTNPLCWAATNPRWGVSSVHQTLRVSVVRKQGFEELPLYSVKAKMGYGSRPFQDRADAFGGWVSVRKGSFLEFHFCVPERKFNVSSGWSVGVVIRRLRQTGGKVMMWLDKDKTNVFSTTGKTFGRVHFQTRIYFVASQLSPGQHTLSVTTSGPKRISLLINGIVLGPAGIRGFQGYKPTGTIEKVWSLEDYKKFKNNVM